MRKLFLLYATIIFSLGLSAQDSSSLPVMKQKIDSFQKRLDDANYTRIPKQDFENLLSNSVTNEVNESIKKWIFFLGALIGLVGVFIAGYFKNQIKTQVDESLKNKLDALSTKIDQQIQNEKEENARQDLKLAEVTKRIDKILADQLQFSTDSATLIDKKIKDILSFAWDDIAESKLRLSEEKKFTGLELILEITAFLENKEIQIRKEKRITLIDALMRCYYITPNVEDKYKNMIQLLRKYETDFELLPETYANAAIALSSSYQESGVRADRDTCIDSCDKSIRRLKDYGEPYAIKLEVFMMDHKKAFDAKEENEAIENIKRTFNAIKNNNSKVLCLQIITRLTRDSNVASLKQYIDNLEKMFKDDLLNVRQRITTDIVSDRKFFNLEEDTKLFTDIMNNDLVKSLDITGNWECRKLIINGKESNLNDGLQSISFKDYTYSLTRNNIIENGFVHFLAYTKNAAMNFYKKEGDEDKFSDIIYAIYEIENDELIICFNPVTEERPKEFLSTPENQFILAYFNKAA